MSIQQHCVMLYVNSYVYSYHQNGHNSPSIGPINTKLPSPYRSSNPLVRSRYQSQHPDHKSQLLKYKIEQLDEGFIYASKNIKSNYEWMMGLVSYVNKLLCADYINGGNPESEWGEPTLSSSSVLPADNKKYGVHISLLMFNMGV